jgi:hypothetical protein
MDDGKYHYYEVHGGSGKIKEGYQIVVNFLNDCPIIQMEYNYHRDSTGLSGTWCTYEVGIPISQEEYLIGFSKPSIIPM